MSTDLSDKNNITNQPERDGFGRKDGKGRRWRRVKEEKEKRREGEEGNGGRKE